MKKTGAALVCYGLEQLGVQHVFGLPDDHLAELYDQLLRSEQITPVLVTHEMAAGFMADALSRCSDQLGVAVLAPGPGISHAVSAISEAYIAGIPMLVVTVDIEQGARRFARQQLHHRQLLTQVTKQCFLPTSNLEIVDRLFEAAQIARAGQPGPVLYELPASLLLELTDISDLPEYLAGQSQPVIDMPRLQQAAEMLLNAQQPGLFVGWGARGATSQIAAIAELLAAPVATTFQGLAVFPSSHRLHTGMGFGKGAVPAASQAFADCDCLLAVGTRFSELATGDYSAPVPENLIHIDIDGSVFDVNYPAKVAIECEAIPALQALHQLLLDQHRPQRTHEELAAEIARDKHLHTTQWQRFRPQSGVSPYEFFNQLGAVLSDDAIVVADSGQHALYLAELLPFKAGQQFLSPSDFGAMGYCIPAANAAALAHPQRMVVGVVGDGAMLMTGLESLTAASLGLNVIYFIFDDGALSQSIDHETFVYQRPEGASSNRVQWQGLAQATGCEFATLRSADGLARIMRQLITGAGRTRPLIVDVRIDDAKPSRYAEGVGKARFDALDTLTKTRMLGRSIWRKFRR